METADIYTLIVAGVFCLLGFFLGDLWHKRNNRKQKTSFKNNLESCLTDLDIANENLRKAIERIK